MKSLWACLIGVALGATLFLGVPSAKAQFPNGISYQGLLTENGMPYSGPRIPLRFTFSDKIGNILFTQFDTVAVMNGVFNTVLGPFPSNMKFEDQYSMTIVVTDPASGTTTTLAPSALLWSAPYALNAQRVNGIDVSATPVNGDIFPIPLDATGKIAASMLPAISIGQLPVFIQSINGIAPDSFEGFEIKGGPGVTITSGDHSITISSDQLSPNLGVETLTALHASSTSPAITAVDSEANGNTALMVQGGIGANNSSGIADGSGLNSGSPQTYWADQVSVPAATTTTIVIYNTLVSATSTILVTPVGVGAFGGGITVTSQGAGTFTISSKNPMGTGGGGMVTALNYMVVNH
jgi:hypothetical protein